MSEANLTIEQAIEELKRTRCELAKADQAHAQAVRARDRHADEMFMALVGKEVSSLVIEVTLRGALRDDNAAVEAALDRFAGARLANDLALADVILVQTRAIVQAVQP